jgi:hypothetical protein
MLPGSPKRWVDQTPRPPRPTVQPDLNAEVQARAKELVEVELKPRHIQPPREDEPFNYIVDLPTKWYHAFFYFCATYRCHGPNALYPFLKSGSPAWNIGVIGNLRSPMCAIRVVVGAVSRSLPERVPGRDPRRAVFSPLGEC